MKLWEEEEQKEQKEFSSSSYHLKNKTNFAFFKFSIIFFVLSDFEDEEDSIHDYGDSRSNTQTRSQTSGEKKEKKRTQYLPRHKKTNDEQQISCFERKKGT